MSSIHHEGGGADWRGARSKDYALAALAGVWLADGIALLVAPRYIITQVLELPQQSSAILCWELVATIGGVFLFFAAQELFCNGFGW